MSQSILQQLNQAHKAITTDSLGESLLNPEKQDDFIRVATEKRPLLDEARRIDMQSHTRNIDRISLTGQMLRTVGETEAAAAGDDPDFFTNKLIAEELSGSFSLTDQSLEDNLAKGTLENTLVTLAGQRAGLDLANLFLNGDAASGDTAINRTDGWLKLSPNKLVAVDDFDATDVESMFDNLIEALDKKYLEDPADWTIWTDWNTANAYRKELRGRQTGLGDAAQTSMDALVHGGFEIRYDAHIPAGAAMLSRDDNNVWGVYRDIRIEPSRKPEYRRTDFVVSTRVDCNYEDENAVVTASGFTGKA